jgi:signal transduction histidine kinase
VPAEDRHEASPRGERGPVEAGSAQRRPRARAVQRLERAETAALRALQAVSSYSEAGVELPEFFGRLSETVAGLVKARRVAFWRLGLDNALAVQPKPHGFPASSPVHDLRIRLPDRFVFRDENEIVKGTSPDLDALWRANGLAGVRNSIAVSWRAGERQIGALAAYDSRSGFTEDDAWVLRIAAMATGLMWQNRETEQQLDVTAERLEEAAAARRQLLGNIAAGGDEARRRFASVLHDDSLQLLTAAELQLERSRSEGDPTRHAAQLGELEVTLKKVEDSLRRLLMNMSPKAADLPRRLDEAIRARLDTLRSHTGIEPDIDLRLPDQLPESIQSTVLKNVSEALTNVEKHAHATRIRLSARPVEGGIRVVVADDGKGFVVAESMYVPGHLGLMAIRERAHLVGGRCRIDSEPGAGARVEFWVPVSV